MLTLGEAARPLREMYQSAQRGEKRLLVALLEIKWSRVIRAESGGDCVGGDPQVLAGADPAWA